MTTVKWTKLIRADMGRTIHLAHNPSSRHYSTPPGPRPHCHQRSWGTAHKSRYISYEKLTAWHVGTHTWCKFCFPDGVPSIEGYPGEPKPVQTVLGGSSKVHYIRDSYATMCGKNRSREPKWVKAIKESHIKRLPVKMEHCVECKAKFNRALRDYKKSAWATLMQVS